MKASALSRRRFLGAVGGALAAGTVLSLDGVSGAVPAATLPRSGAFAQPEVLTSSGGRLDVKLVAAPSKVAFGSRRRFAFTYNGSTPGPTLRVRPGDRLSVTLVNRLGEPTNLHTHGLHVSPSGHSDNVFVTIPDGGRRSYVYEIPTTHRSGTFWYHPHKHGLVARQLFGGLAGAIVVEDDIDSIPELAGATERILVLNDGNVGTSSSVVDASMRERMLGREGDTVFVNGVKAPTIDGVAGKLEHWRVVNASTSRYYRLTLEDHAFQVIGTDGGRLAAPVEMSEVLLTPGERVEFLLTPSSAGTFAFQSLPYDRGSPGFGRGGGGSTASPTLLVATFQVEGDAAAAALPATLAPTSSLALPEATKQREVVLAMGMGGRGGGGGGGGGARFTIDGKTFDPARTDITTRLGRVEEWTLVNASPMDHPFHLHVWPFQVVARSDGGSIPPGWKDTVNLPAHESVTVRLPITGISGRTVYHCHILDHEDLGMMGVIKVT